MRKLKQENYDYTDEGEVQGGDRLERNTTNEIESDRLERDINLVNASFPS